MILRERVRAMAARLYSPRTAERLIDPVLTDIEIEYRAAIAAGRTWRGHWIRIAGYFALLKGVALYAYDRTARDWRADDRRTFARTVGISAIAFAVTALLLISLSGRRTPADLLPYLIPQALPLAIPVGITLGIFFGLGGRLVAFRLKAAAIALAFACSAGSLVTTLWIMPAGNQAYRVAVMERLTPGKSATLRPGAAETPIGELRQKVDALTRSGPAMTARNMAFGYLAYYLLLLAGAFAARQNHLPVVASVWLPNLAFAIASTAVMAAAARPRLSSGS